MKKSIFIMAMALSFLYGLAQDPSFDNTIYINQNFNSTSEIFPFNGETLYGTGINGNIVFNSDISLARLILKDSVSGLEYMIYETYPMLDTIWNFSFNEKCEETCFLDGFVATSLEIWLIDATLHLNDLKWSGSPMANITDLQKQSKTASDLEKIDAINAFLTGKGMIWKAGPTSYSNLFYKNKKTLFGNAYNLFGLEFYKGDIFEVYGVLDTGINDPTYGVVNNFD